MAFKEFEIMVLSIFEASHRILSRRSDFLQRVVDIRGIEFFKPFAESIRPRLIISTHTIPKSMK